MTEESAQEVERAPRRARWRRIAVPVVIGLASILLLVSVLATWVNRVALDNETFSFLNWAFWRCGGCMLVGMALLGFGFFHGTWPRPAYAALALLIPRADIALEGLLVRRGHVGGYDRRRREAARRGDAQ